MSKEERLQLENELLITYNKEQAINKYIDELEESSKLSELWCKSQQENKELKKTIEKIKEHVEEFGNGKFKVVFGIHILKIIGGKNEWRN